MRWIDDIMNVGSGIVIWLSAVTAGLFAVLMVIPLLLKVIYNNIREENEEIE